MGWVKCGNYNSIVDYLVDPTELVRDVYLDGATGNEVAYNGWSATPFISVIAGETLKVASANNDVTYNCYYDSNKTFISSFTFPANKGYSEFTIPSGVSYIRCSDNSNMLNNLMIWRDRGCSNSVVVSGGFTSGTSQYDKVEIDCGFQPDFVQVKMEFESSHTIATYTYKDNNNSINQWDLRPTENVVYDIPLGEVNGETGISDITNTGFKYRVNASNTWNKACTYVAVKFLSQLTPTLVYKNYIKFNGEGIILPWTLNSDYKIEVVFCETEYLNDASVIGNSYGPAYSHLTEYGNIYYCSQGTREAIFGTWATGEHTFVNNNGNNKNEFDGVEVTDYDPQTNTGIKYTIGCRGVVNSNIWYGYIKSYKIYSISNNSLLHELKPCMIENSACFIDTVERKIYTNDSITAVDSIS